MQEINPVLIANAMHGPQFCGHSNEFCAQSNNLNQFVRLGVKNMQTIRKAPNGQISFLERYTSQDKQKRMMSPTPRLGEHNSPQ